MRYDRKPTTVLKITLLAGFIFTAPAATIDDFSTPQGPLTGVPNVVSGPGIVGGFRQASDPFFAVDGGLATFSYSSSVPGTNLIGLAYDGTPEPSDGGGFAPLVDLTDGGTASQFLLGISEVTGVVAVLVSVTDADELSIGTSFAGLTSPGLYTAPLPIIPTNPDFTRIQRVDVVLFLSPLESNLASIGVDFICTGTLEAGCTTAEPTNPVPEPESWAMLALLIVGLPFIGRRCVAKSE